MPDSEPDLRQAAKARWRARREQAAASSLHGIQQLDQGSWCQVPAPGTPRGEGPGATWLADGEDRPREGDITQTHRTRLAVSARTFPTRRIDFGYVQVPRSLPRPEAPLEEVFPEGDPG